MKRKRKYADGGTVDDTQYPQDRGSQNDRAQGQSSADSPYNQSQGSQNQAQQSNFYSRQVGDYMKNMGGKQ